jgi:hypothetical protein
MHLKSILQYLIDRVQLLCANFDRFLALSNFLDKKIYENTVAMQIPILYKL